MRFLAALGVQLAEMVDPDEALDRVANLAVPALADIAFIEISDPGWPGRRMAVCAADGDKQEELRRVHVCRVAGIWNHARMVTETGAAELIANYQMPEPDFSSEEGAEPWAVLRSLELRSLMIVPLVVHSRSIGVIVLAGAESGRIFRPRDLALAQELALRASLWLENHSLLHATRRAVEVRDSVLSVVSHDLRNFLGAIRLNAEALSRHVTRIEVDRIRRASIGMNRLISDLLDVASIQAGRLSLQRKSCEDVGAIAKEVIGLFEPAARAKLLDVRCELPDYKVGAIVDRDRIAQVLTNLVGNSVKFCRERDQIVVRLEDRERELTFEVTDSGPGITTPQLERIFDAYWTEPRRANSGTGLGLTIAKGIVEAHGGRIWVNGEPDAGLTLRFAVPRARLESRTPSAISL
jgi:signal transduction histidine kinase